MPRFYTSTEIATKLSADLNRVRYLLATRNHIAPIRRAGLVRLYDESVIAAVSRELEAGGKGRADK